MIGYHGASRKKLVDLALKADLLTLFPKSDGMFLR